MFIYELGGSGLESRCSHLIRPHLRELYLWLVCFDAFLNDHLVTEDKSSCFVVVLENLIGFIFTSGFSSAVIVAYFVIAHCTFPGYFPMWPALNPSLWSPYMPPSALSYSLIPPCCFLLSSLSLFLMLLLYCKCYGFEREFLTLWRFLHYTPSSPLAFIKVSTLMAAGLHTVVQNTVSAQMFVIIPVLL